MCLKKCDFERLDFYQKTPFFHSKLSKSEKETTDTHTKERPTNVFPQHHIKNYAANIIIIIMFAPSFNAVRSSPSISKNVSKTRSSSRSSSTVKVRAMGMKKGSFLFSFLSSRNPTHLVFKNGCSFSL